MQYTHWLTLALLVFGCNCKPTIKLSTEVWSQDGSSGGGRFTSGKVLPMETNLSDNNGGQQTSPEVWSQNDAGGGENSTRYKFMPKEVNLSDERLPSDKFALKKKSLAKTHKLLRKIRDLSGDGVPQASSWSQWTYNNMIYLGNTFARSAVRTMSSFVGQYTMKGLDKGIFFISDKVADVVLRRLGQEGMLQGNGTLALLRKTYEYLKKLNEPNTNTWLKEITTSADYAFWNELQRSLTLRGTASAYVGVAVTLFKIIRMPIPHGDGWSSIKSAMASFSPTFALSGFDFLIRIPQTIVHPFKYLASFIF